MRDYRPYEPTEEEKEHADKLALEAAYEALRPVMADDIESSQAVTVFLRAFDAADRAGRKYQGELLEKNPGFTHVSLYTETAPIVCSAFYALENDCLEVVSPHSVAGHRLVALVNAAKAMEALSALDAALDSDPSFTDYTAGDALTLALKANEANRIEAQS